MKVSRQTLFLHCIFRCRFSVVEKKANIGFLSAGDESFRLNVSTDKQVRGYLPHEQV